MNEIIQYLFESALGTTVLYFVYRVFLRRETFFRLNRIYLIGMIIFSLIIPLVPFSRLFAEETGNLAVILQPVLISPGTIDHVIALNWQWVDVLTAIYLSGVAFLLIRLLFMIAQLFMITGQFGIHRKNGLYLVPVDQGFAPFSFFNLVFINERSLAGSHLNTILAHEKVHIGQHHTFDLIIAEILTIVQWFNPVVWLMRKDFKSLHEFLADEGVLQTGISASQYQQMILNESMGIRVNDLTNNFNVSLLQKRIVMMTKSKSGKLAKAKLILALPAVLLLTTLFTASSFSNSDLAPARDAKNDLSLITPTEKSASPDTVVKENKSAKAFIEVEVQPAYPGGYEAMAKFMVENVKYPEAAKNNKVQGTVFVTFTVSKKGKLNNVKVLRGIGSRCDEEAVRVIKKMPAWEPALSQGKPVEAAITMPVKFALN